MNIVIMIYNILASETHHQGFSFNADFLEANVINILLLLSGLVYLLKQFLGALLITRRQKVLTAIQESEDRLKKANIRLAESEKQFKQTKMVIKQIEQEAVITAAKVRKSILDQGKLDIERLAEVGKTSIAIAERQVREQIQQQITSLAINQVRLDFENQITNLMQNQIIDENIMKLGDKL